MPTVLLVEDEVWLGQIVKDSLEVRGFQVWHAMDGAQGLTMYQTHSPDVVVLDVMMPQLDGFTLTERIRSQNATVPIIFLTARSQTVDVVKGFELGGNDYLKKPFSMDELIVRIKALLNRKITTLAQPENEQYQIGQYLFDYPKQKLIFKGKDSVLSYRESELLKRLFLQRNQVLERSKVLQDLWGDDNFFNGRSLDVFITHLRNYLKADPHVQIVNIRGIGYKLIV
ncbi:response regulator transcription factor [Rhodocytophaga rosea]|uniref:Response regulator transcription factor n=1 Tax=Rhodocytophaga rosea TaxID=2704465 RepID=A0A6C0GCZ6_9BACT|nr:response regulator transcription factor [Rhodocytophaga rosea]QHT65859.1 response regulator transcription factor [Rhodocytophaga rosea]